MTALRIKMEYKAHHGYIQTKKRIPRLAQRLKQENIWATEINGDSKHIAITYDVSGIPRKLSTEEIGSMLAIISSVIDSKNWIVRIRKPR